MNSIKGLMAEGIDRYLARKVHVMISQKERFPLYISIFMLFLITAPLVFMPIWYQILTCSLITIGLGRVAWLAGKMKNGKV
jgi:hypothetical protein